jgi:hypothetical protein
LPVISALTATYPWVIGVKKTDSTSNTVTISRASSDTIDGATSKVLNIQNQGAYFMPSVTPAPDMWTTSDFGPRVLNKVTKTTTYTALSSDDIILADGTSASFTITLPAAATYSGKVFNIKKIDTDTTKVITIDGNASETIDGFATISLKSYLEAVEIVSDGTNWRIISRHGTVPTLQTFTSGSGTYTTPLGAKWLRVRMCGGGASGGSGNGGTNGNVGVASTFGSSLLTANGGTNGLTGANQNGGAGGSATISSPAYGRAISGGYGGGSAADSGTVAHVGGHGGCNAFGGFGGTSGATQANISVPAANSGGGGGGGGSAGGGTGSGSGGGAGGYIDAIIPSPSATYAYAVGAGGASGGGGNAAAAGAAGIIIVEEFYI